METMKKNGSRIVHSLTFKVITILFLVLLLLIPNKMIQGLIVERQDRSREAVERINEKWSMSQRVVGPVLTIPYVVELNYDDEKKTEKKSFHQLHLSPEILTVNAALFPEERHYGIYKTILYKSKIEFSGKFSNSAVLDFDNFEILWDKAFISIGMSDLRGIANNVEMILNNQKFLVESSEAEQLFGKRLIIPLKNFDLKQNLENLEFKSELELNGSANMSFVPIGNTTEVKLTGNWKSPGFFGSFSPEYQIENDLFSASWNVLSFNRSIPEKWIDNELRSFSDSVFGVNLIDTIDHYQQNMRSAKYSLMFIVLTFVVFFFVEVLTKKRIHPIQYLLVGIALVLFYSLLLSFSEHIGFALAYLIASVAIIALISIYSYSVFKNKTQTIVLTALLCILYVFLYVILQLEDTALLIGSLGLFVILAVVMYVSRKINWYKNDDEITAD